MFSAGFYKDSCDNNTFFFKFLFTHGTDPFYPAVRGVAVGAAVDFHHAVRTPFKEHRLYLLRSGKSRPAKRTGTVNVSVIIRV